MNIGKCIKQIRVKRGISKTSFAKSIGMTRSHLQQIENEQYKSVNPTYLARIADRFDENYWDLMKISGYDIPCSAKFYSENAQSINDLSAKKLQFLKRTIANLRLLPDS